MSMASGARWTRLLWLRLLLLCGLLEHVLCASAALKAALLRQQEEPPPKTPTPDSCVAQSLSDPGWFIYDPTYMFVNTSSPTHATDPVGHVWFTLVNRATSQTLHCLSNGVHLEPKNQKPEDGWYRCESEGTDASFHFNLTTLTISIRENWKCDGDES